MSSYPAIVTLAGFVPCAVSGITIFRRCSSSPRVGEVRAEEHQPGQLALAAGRRLQADRVEARDLAQDLLQLPLELERALRRVVLDERMQVARTRAARRAAR